MDSESLKMTYLEVTFLKPRTDEILEVVITETLESHAIAAAPYESLAFKILGTKFYHHSYQNNNILSIVFFLLLCFFQCGDYVDHCL